MATSAKISMIVLTAWHAAANFSRWNPIVTSFRRQPQEKTSSGRLSMHRDGFGFVLPDPTSLDDRLKARLSGDIFIPPPAVGSAMHGDRVLVEIGTIRPDGRAEGRIVRPVNRAHPTVVGIFHYG